MSDYSDAIAQEKIKRLISNLQDPNKSTDPDILKYHLKIAKKELASLGTNRDYEISKAESNFRMGEVYIGGSRGYRNYYNSDKKDDINEANNKYERESKLIASKITNLEQAIYINSPQYETDKRVGERVRIYNNSPEGKAVAIRQKAQAERIAEQSFLYTIILFSVIGVIIFVVLFAILHK